MRDEIEGRLWSDHHEAFSASLHRGFAAIALVFCKMARIQFSAPWRTPGDAC